jgi:hypothetical protein
VATALLLSVLSVLAGVGGNEEAVEQATLSILREFTGVSVPPSSCQFWDRLPVFDRIKQRCDCMHATCQVDPNGQMCSLAVHLTLSPTLAVSACAEDDLLTVSRKVVCKRVAAMLECDYKVIKADVMHVIDQYNDVFWEPLDGDAEAVAAGGFARAQPSCLEFVAHWAT